MVPKPRSSVANVPSFFDRHRPSILVLFSQLSAAIAHASVKMLESGKDEDEFVDPFTILLVRMLITGVGSSSYLWYQKVPEFPLGQREVRPLLMLRATGGILGTAGMYYSIKYLSLSQATALNFLAPMCAMIWSRYKDNGSCTILDRAGAVIALAGVVMVVQPDGIFSAGETVVRGSEPESHAKIKGVGCGIVGIVGTVIALNSMRRIGSRAHPLTMVNYLAWVVFLAAANVVVIRQTKWPTGLFTWGTLILIGVAGGSMEFLLTLGISSDPSSEATIMIYSQALWALGLDEAVWGVSMNAWTWAGVAHVIGSLTLVTLAKEMSPYGKGWLALETVETVERNDTTIHDIEMVNLESSSSTDAQV